MLVDFCLPIKNEALILEVSLNKLLTYCGRAGFSFSWRIIGIINGSSDTSADILWDFKRRWPGQIDFIEVVEPGRGRALKRYWSTSTADVLCYMDCDLAVSLDNLPALIMPLINNEADLAIGSRLTSGAAVKRSLFREFISQAYNLLSRFLLNHKIADLQCGFKAVRRETFQRVRPYLVDDYWFFDTELTLLALRFGFRVRQVPVDWRENRYQRRPSTVKIWRDSWDFLKNLIAFRRRLKKIKKYPGSV
ncbi:MAG: glycosyltransferase [Candidatus Falkowbacteria bacterium]|nr:glycosyltransferase [Candidatus Falkowbacteria bacterium]